MPVTFPVNQCSPGGWGRARIDSEDELFQQSCNSESRLSKGIIQSSFSRRLLEENRISPSSNGFVHGAFQAYNHHHHLVIRPDDVWSAILTQTGFYINAHAEELRHLFVTHEGQKELEVVDAGSLKSTNFGRLAVRMTKLIQDNVIDPDLRDWVMPSFSTTTEVDTVVASILFMGSMQHYFSYKMSLLCGLPGVTLLGEKEDWCNLAKRIPKLAKLGDEASRFAELLTPVLRKMIESFDRPTSADTVDFWSRIAAYHGGGSGPRYLSGWITAFCFWDEKGECLARNVPTPSSGRPVGVCELDGVYYHKVDTNDIPSGFASVPVTVDDNGEIYHTKMVAGSVAIKATSSAGATTEPFLDTIQPVLGWWMYEVEGPQECREQELESKRSKNPMHGTEQTVQPSQRAHTLRSRLQEVAVE